MPLSPPAAIGQHTSEIDTPALVVDLDALERNIDTLAGKLPAGVKLRAHAKTHKSADIAHLQMNRGAVGVCCQKTSEAQMLIEAGVPDVMISNQVVGAQKLAIIAELLDKARISVCVDDADNIDDLSAAVIAAGHGQVLDVFVEINVGANRCGVEPGAAAVELARHINRSDGLRFAGLQAYHGTAQHLRTLKERKTAIDGAVDKVRLTLDLLEAAAIECPVVAGAGTGTFEIESASGVYNELQAGSYIFMDADYARNFDHDGNPVSQFEHALFVLSTVMSSTRPGHAVLDAGHKAVSIDSGFPTAWQSPGVSFTGASDEHGVLTIEKPAPTPQPGDRVWLVPGHCDPTVNLHNWYVAVRNNVVEAVWTVHGRGAVY